MTFSHDAVTTAKSLVKVTKQYLLEIQSNEDWSLVSQNYISDQSKLTEILRDIKLDSLLVNDRNELVEQLRICYQLELQINQLINRQQMIVSGEIAQMKKNSQFKSKYEGFNNESGIMLDTYN